MSISSFSIKIKETEFIIQIVGQEKLIFRSMKRISPIIKFSEVENGVINSCRVSNNLDLKAEKELNKYLPLYRAAIDKYKKLMVFI